MGAPVGNTYALCNSGKAKKFSSPEELQQSVDGYFAEMDANPIKIWHSQLSKADNLPVAIPTQRPYSIEGLALSLGLTRQSLLNYQKEEGYEEYFDIITYAKEKITQQRIELASVGVLKENFTKFLLVNNTDYVDKSETANSHKIETPPEWLDGKLSDERPDQ